MLPKIFNFRTCLIVFCLFGAGFSDVMSKCKFDLIMGRHLIKDGFHRNLTYHLIFNEFTEPKAMYIGCKIGLDQFLPAGLYVNPDELDEFRRLDRLNAIPRSRVNIELSAEDAKPMSVFIISDLTDDEIKTWLPIHARYQPSASGGGTIHNEILPPKVYLYCADHRLDVCDRSVSPGVTLTCDGGLKMCTWRDIPFTVSRDPLIWSVPIGDVDHFYIIGISTGVVMMIGTTIVIRAMHDHIYKHRRLVIR